MNAHRLLIGPELRRATVRTARSICTVLIAFFAGMLVHAHLASSQVVAASSDQVFELMIYHTLPDKAPALESIFQDVSKLQEKHGINPVGYWVPTGNDPAWENTFVYIVAHPSLEAAKANWKALHADPAFPPYFKAAAPLIQRVDGVYKVDEIYMRPSVYSAIK